jgi:hypothetical protein
VFENLNELFYFSSSVALNIFGPFGGTVILLWLSDSQLRLKRLADGSWYEVDELQEPVFEKVVTECHMAFRRRAELSDSEECHDMSRICRVPSLPHVSLYIFQVKALYYILECILN